MKPLRSFFYLFSVVTLLSSYPIYANADENLVQQVCEETHDKAHCVASLESNPDSKQANLPQLVIIALGLAASNATDTSVYIKKLLSEGSLDPAIEQAITDCTDYYLDAVEQLDNSIAALLDNAYNDVRTWVQAAVTDASSCESAFKGNAGLLSRRNMIFRQLCNNVLAINKFLI